MKNNHNNQVIDHYNQVNEKDRLTSSWGQIEFVRTQEIIKQYLPPTPCTVLDVGGAAGVYSSWLAEEGHEVHLVDPVPKHIEQAKQISKNQTKHSISTITVGDARDLDFPDSSTDAVLLLGPLYHLTKYDDRIQALKEAYRVLKSGGYLFAVVISRFASCIDGLVSGYYKDKQFQDIVTQDLKNGQHRNHTENELYFTDAFFHHPEELRSEITTVGFHHIATHAIEGISYMLKDFDNKWKSKADREYLLNTIRFLDTELTLLGASPHIMGVAIKDRS